MKKRKVDSPVRKTQRGLIRNCLWIYRKRMGHSQKQVALLIGNKTASHISDYERGKRLPSLETALKLEVTLRTPIAFLYRDLYGKLKREIRQAEENLQSKPINL